MNKLFICNLWYTLQHVQLVEDRQYLVEVELDLLTKINFIECFNDSWSIYSVT